MDRAHLPEVDDGDEYYYADLIGLRAHGADEAELGEIVAIENFGAGDLLEVQPRDAGSYYVPFTRDFVPEIDAKNGWLRVIPPV
jgi:16S rRNA processing protein RimM